MTTHLLPRAGNRFRIFVADNLSSEIDQIVTYLSDLGDDVDFVRSSSHEEALEAPTREFFHVAIVDLRWDKDFAIGTQILRRFRDKHSALLRCMMTKYVEKPQELVGILKDPSRVADFLYDKSDFASQRDLKELIAQRLSEWRETTLAVEGFDLVYDQVRAKDSRLDLKDTSLAGTEAELSHLIRSVFGAALPPSGDRTSVGVSLRSIPSGLSSAVLCEVTPLLGTADDGNPIFGNRCVLKINSVSETKSEVAAYDESVRFSVALDHRVEMLAWSLGARLGVICYSFAGGSKDEVFQLDEIASTEALSQAGRDLVEEVITSMFSLESKKWYSIVGEPTSLQNYFSTKLRFDATAVIDELRRWSAKLARRDGVHLDGVGSLVIGDCKLALPRGDTLGSEIFRRPLPTCLVHGDLHAGNIMVRLIEDDADERYQASLIDFANAGIGPRFFDAATLNGSLRLWDAPQASNAQLRSREEVSQLGSELQRAVQAEQRILQGKPQVAGRAAKGFVWSKAASALDARIQDNFRDADPAEQLATYSMQAARLASHSKLGLLERARCLAWYTALVQTMDRSGMLS